MKLEEGDYLEKNNVEFIREYLPMYESTWKRYIGHNGGGRMPDIPNLSNEEIDKRVQIAQSHYTCL